MDFSYEDLLDINTILADVTQRVGDESTRQISQGSYSRWVKKALNELNFETKFDNRFQDLVLPADLRLPFPKGAWNLIDLFVWNGTLNEEGGESCCTITSSARCYSKNQFRTTGKNRGYTAPSHPGGCDAFYRGFCNDQSIHFFSIQNGLICFSDSCSVYKYVRVIYNGMASDIDKTKMIPPLIREAVTLYAVCEAFAVLKQRDKQYRVDFTDTRAELYLPKGRMSSSVWEESRYRLKMMNTKMANDLNEYNSRGNY